MTPSVFVMIFLTIIILTVYLAFEKSHPKAWELVIVSQMCAICISARLIFSFVPYFNPVIALVMLSAVSLGAKKGFLIGSLTAFGSNFLFGQGPWTLYQMVSWGTAGAVFGLLGFLKIVRRNNWQLKDYILASLFAGVTIIFVTGPISDLSGVFMFGVEDTKGLFALLSVGFFLNFTLAVSTSVTFIIAARTILFALSRVQKNTATATV